MIKVREHRWGKKPNDKLGESKEEGHGRRKNKAMCILGGEGEDVSVSEGCLGLLRAAGGWTTDPTGVRRT